MQFQETSILPPQKELEFSWGGASPRPKNSKKFPEGLGVASHAEVLRLVTCSSPQTSVRGEEHVTSLRTSVWEARLGVGGGGSLEKNCFPGGVS